MRRRMATVGRIPRLRILLDVVRDCCLYYFELPGRKSRLIPLITGDRRFFVRGGIPQ